jgi:hypothetical protein
MENIYKTIKNNSTEEQLDKESIKVLYTKSDNDYSAVLISTLNKSVIYCFMLEGDKVDRVITFRNEGDTPDTPPQWNYSLNLEGGASNLLIGKINSPNFYSLNILGVDKSEIKLTEYNGFNFFYVIKSIPLPIKIQMFDNQNQVIYSN